MDNSIKNMLYDLRSRCQQSESEHSLIPDIHACMDEYVQKNCLRPIKIKYRDRLTYQLKPLYVPCGHCHNCRTKLQGEWTSRMILHTSYCAKHCYFVTLSYGSYDTYDEIPQVLRNAYYRKDDFNYNKRLAYSPCLIRHEHVQRFMKYLRKFHTDRIDFFCGSEYGSDYGRPHHHLILWSNTPISKETICHAWSCRLNRTKYTTLIGRVDYNDLNANGTIIHDGINFGHDMRRCFNYVAKYITKSFVDPNNAVDSRARLNYFIYDISHNLIPHDILNVVMDKRIRSLVAVVNPWAYHYADYMRYKEYAQLCNMQPYAVYDMYNNKRMVYPDTFKYINNKRIYYDYETSDISYVLEHATNEDEDVQLLRSFYATFSPLVFRKIFAPRCVSSRNPAIGVEYFDRHYSEYISGNFVLPKHDGKSLLFPRLFVRKTKEYLYRFAFINKNHLGKSTAPTLLTNSHVYSSSIPDVSSLSLEPYSPHRVLPSVDFGISLDLDKLLRSPYAFHDYLNKQRCLAFVDECNNIFINYYKYDRKNSTFVYQRSENLETFAKSLAHIIKVSKPLRDMFELSVAQNVDDLDFFIPEFSLIIESILCEDFLSYSLKAYDDYMSKLKQKLDSYKKLKPPKPDFRKL